MPRKSNPFMQDAGYRLRQARERLGLRYRDVEEASQKIANQRGNHEFLIGLSRLADIENKGTVPSVYRLYSLCAIYRLDFSHVLAWYGIDLLQLPADAAQLSLPETHLIDFQAADRSQVDFPLDFDENFDFRQTSYLARNIRGWGKLPITLLSAVDVRSHRYAFIGAEDWSMYPVIRPGSFVEIDEAKKRVGGDGWAHTHERPIYFVEHRNGFRCGWCYEAGGLLMVLPHPESETAPGIFRYPGEAEVIGQVVGVAMRLDLGKRRHTRS